MAFKPAGSKTGSSSSGDSQSRNFPVPKSGSRAARLSLIIDLGIQPREDFENKETGEKKPQSPAHQIAAFADLPNDVVDYGNDIGKQPYRLLLNKTFKGDIQGISFYSSPPKDTDGNTIEGRPWGLHINNILSKIAAACGHPEWTQERQFDDGKYIDVTPLLGQAFMATVKIDEREHSQKKTDADGNVIVFKNVSYRGPSQLPMIPSEDGEEAPLKVGALKNPPLMLGFDDTTEEQVKWIRADIRRKIKLAENYAGSQMQKAIEAYEKKLKTQNSESDDPDESAPAPAAKSKTPPKVQSKIPPKQAFDDMDDDVPFIVNLNSFNEAGSGLSKSALRAKYGKGLSLAQANRGEF